MARDTLRLPVAVKRFATSTPAKASGLAEGSMPEPAPTPRPGDEGADRNDATTMFGLAAGFDDDTQLLGMELQTNDDDTMVLQQKAFGANQAHLPGIGLGERLFEMLLQPQAPATSNALEVSRTIELGSSLVGRTPQRPHSRMKPGNLSSAQKRNLRTSIGAGGQTYVDCELDVRFGDDIVTEEAEDTSHQEQVEIMKQTINPTVRKVDWISQIKTFDRKMLAVVKEPEGSQISQHETSRSRVSATHATLETAEDVFQVAFSEPYRDSHTASGSSSPPPAPVSTRKTPSKAQRKRRQSIMSSSPAYLSENVPRIVDNAAIQSILRRSPRKSNQGSQPLSQPPSAASEAIEEAGHLSVPAIGLEVGEESPSEAVPQAPPVTVPSQPALRRSPRKSTGSRKSLDATQRAVTEQTAATSRLPQQARKSLASTRAASEVSNAQQYQDAPLDKSTRGSINQRRETRKAKRAQAISNSDNPVEATTLTSQYQTASAPTSDSQISARSPELPSEGEVQHIPATKQQDQFDVPSSPARERMPDMEEHDSGPTAPAKSPFPVFRRLDPLSPVMEDSEKEREKEMSMERSLLLQRALATQVSQRHSDIQAPQPGIVSANRDEEGEPKRIEEEQGPSENPLPESRKPTEERASSMALSRTTSERPGRSSHERSSEPDGSSLHTYALAVPLPTLAAGSRVERSNSEPAAPTAYPPVQQPSHQASDDSVPVLVTSQVLRPISRQAERPRSRQSTASSQARAKAKAKPYERPKPSRTAASPQASMTTSRPVHPVASTSRLPAKAPAVGPSVPTQMQKHIEQPRGRTRNLSVPVNFSPGQKKRPKPNVSRQASVDDMFSRRQRDSSRGRGLETASQADSTTSSRRARSETARSLTQPAPAPSHVSLSVGDKQKRGLLTEPKTFTFASTSASTKRKREHNTQVAASGGYNKPVHRAAPPRVQNPKASVNNVNAMAMRCQAETEAQEDEVIVPLTMQALQAHEILGKSLGEIHSPDQSLSAAEHNKTAKSQTVLRYLKELADNQSDHVQLEGQSEHSGDSAAEDVEPLRSLVATSASRQQEQVLQHAPLSTQTQSSAPVVQEEVQQVEDVEGDSIRARAKRARYEDDHNAAEPAGSRQPTAVSSSKHVTASQGTRYSKHPVQPARTSSQVQRQRNRKSPRAGVKAKPTEATNRHKSARPAIKAHPTQPQPFTFMSVGKEQASFQERLRTWQEREETAAKSGRRALQPLAPSTGLQLARQNQPSRKNIVRQQKQPLEIRPFAFPSDKRMEERREWEERLRAKERIKAELAAIERAEAEAREAAEIKEMRRNQIIRANPLPAYITEKRTIH